MHPKRNQKINRQEKYDKYRIQAYDSIMSGYFCIGFFDFMLKGNKKNVKVYQFLSS